MPTHKKQEPSQRALQFSFFVGLSLIVLATVHNVGFDGMTQAERLTLPSFLADNYAKYGKLGVTMFLVVLGLGIMILGLTLQSLWGRSRRRGGWVAPEHLAPSPPWNGADNAPAQAGRVVLATQKYMEWNEHAGMQRWETPEG
jgi:hypothetical protein